MLSGASLQGDRFSVIAAKKSTKDGAYVLEAGHSAIKIHTLANSDTATEVIDICSGSAIMTAGYSLVTQVRGHDLPNMRHIHPEEVAILHMVPTDHLQHAGPRRLRLDLTALGQMASPAQAL